MTRIKLVLFDALQTLITPRLPIHVQYAQVFEQYLGALDPDRVRDAFSIALKELQRDKPLYRGGKEEWWGELIKMTAVSAGADPQGLWITLPDNNEVYSKTGQKLYEIAVATSIGVIVPELLDRFSGKKGYMAYDDVTSTLRWLRKGGIKTGLVSNADLRIKTVLSDLGLSKYLQPVLISEEQGVEKPAKEIWERACSRAGVNLHEAMHVGDDMERDYLGAKRAGLAALLLHRKDQAQLDKDLTGVKIIRNLTEVVTDIGGYN